LYIDFGNTRSSRSSFRGDGFLIPGPRSRRNITEFVRRTQDSKRRASTMGLKRLATWTAAALAVVAALGFSGAARADYSYATTVSFGSGFNTASTFTAGTGPSSSIALFVFTGQAGTNSLPPFVTSTPNIVSLSTSAGSNANLPGGSINYIYDLKITNPATT